MTNDEMDKAAMDEYIHTKIMGYCPHLNHTSDGFTVQCQDCPHSWVVYGFAFPAYCSEDSPRSLLSAVVKKVASPNNYANFEDALLEAIRPFHTPDEWRTYNNSYVSYLMINATAEQRCRALIAAWEGK